MKNKKLAKEVKSVFYKHNFFGELSDYETLEDVFEDLADLVDEDAEHYDDYKGIADDLMPVAEKFGIGIDFEYYFEGE